MTSATMSVPISFRAVKRIAMTDASVAKHALYCATVVLCSALGVIGWIVSTTGDVGAVSFAIGGFLTAVVTAAGNAWKNRRNGVQSDG